MLSFVHIFLYCHSCYSKGLDDVVAIVVVPFFASGKNNDDVAKATRS